MSSPDDQSEPEDLGTYYNIKTQPGRPDSTSAALTPPENARDAFHFEPRERRKEPPPEATLVEPVPMPSAGQTGPTLAQPVSSESGDTPGGRSGSDPADGPRLPSVIAPGVVLFDQYKTIRLLGEGGMGEVWLVQNMELDDERALKLIRPDRAFSPEARSRFRHEAQLMARIKHPNSVSVHSAKIKETVAYIEMETVKGKSLDKLLDRGEPPPLAWTHGVTEQLCSILNYIHGPKVNTVHRDLKPQNLMLQDETSERPGLLKLLDLGIAKSLTARAPGVAATVQTASGSMLFTTQYASPEQINQAMSEDEDSKPGEIDHRADLYALGVILYQFLTGYLPFEGPFQSLIFKHLNDAPQSFAKRNPMVRVPAGLERLVMRCLEKDRNKRPQSAWEIIDEFRRHLPAELLAGAIPPTQSDYPELWPCRPGETTATSWEGSTGSTIEFVSTKPSRWRLAVALGAVACLAGGVALFAAKGKLPSPLTINDSEPIKKKKEVQEASGLPEWLAAKGFEAAPGAKTVDGWPDRIVRPVKDRLIGFRLIQGGSFIKGRSRFEIKNANLPPDQKEFLSNFLTEAIQPGPSPSPTKVARFYMQEFEVTNREMEEYRQSEKFQTLSRSKGMSTEDLMKERAPHSTQYNPRQKKDSLLEGLDYPVCGVRHDLAVDYAAWIGGKLPTEAQWEFAARSGGRDVFFTWERKPALPGIDVFVDKKVILDAPALSYLIGAEQGNDDKTEQGIFNLLGNLREWCRDPYEGPGNYEYVIRGGSFSSRRGVVSVYSPRSVSDSDPEVITEIEKDKASYEVGFRVVIEIDQAP
jgi:eukaryotic-like serine/threonine-protein kinase